MKPFIVIAVLAWSLTGGVALGQKENLILTTRAKLDFERVDAEPIPKVEDALTCVQSHAAALPVTRLEERYLIEYRKGYCELFAAVLTGNSDSFQSAARDFTEAVADWPKKILAPPATGLRAIIAIARIEQGRATYPDLAKDFGAVLSDPNCEPTPLMSGSFCKALIDTARTWLAWLAYRNNEFERAQALVQPVKGSVWGMYISGRLAQNQKRMDEAASLYQKSLDTWSAAVKSRNPEVVTLFGPKLDTAAVQCQLGLVDYSRQRYDAAIAHLDAALKLAPKDSYTIFLRGRSKDALRLVQPALDDYALAAQTARANNDTSWGVGQAHYYRGLLLYQAKDYMRAEGEFANALGARLTDITPADVTAWRTMAAVAGGACKSGDQLESAAKSASSQFPKEQADALLFECRVKQASNLDQYLALEKTYSGKIDAAKLRPVRQRIAGYYADQGVAAEDRKDPYSAVTAYRRALEWDPANTKARFNLGAIYIDEKRYDLAEAEYRALVEADTQDYEAQYWLAQSILAQRPPVERAIEACGLLRRSLAIGDEKKKAEFAKAMAAAKCPNRP